jgi:DNA-directed RNA polymerase specialized sigma24 family protein
MRRVPALSRFEDVDALLTFLAGRDGDLDEKDRIYADLIREAQGGSDLAVTLLWLGLWPALSGILRRLSFGMTSSEDPVSEVAESFSRRIQRLDRGSVHRVAATIVRSTERDIRERRRTTRATEEREIVLLEEAHVSDEPILPEEREVALLRERLARLVGDDADLVLGAVVYGVPQSLLGTRLGITPDAARKRFQRALKRLRTELR